jgi:ferredoxin
MDMGKMYHRSWLWVVGLLYAITAAGQQRFPRPDFESNYKVPSPTAPEPRWAMLEFVDVAVLVLVMSLATWLVLKKRSRKGVLYLLVFSLIYFGFYRNGCICPIGAIQNVALALADPGYAISLSALAFFVLPLLFTLFAGRVFCAGACPLGAIQDIVVFKPVSVPLGARIVLGMLPYLYLALAILYAITKTDFIICRYDPFVGFFRMDGPWTMLTFGGLLLLAGMFVARPYCRFLCPYGVMLGWMSLFSKRHLTITPSECIDCKLCATSCPVDAIRKPSQQTVSSNTDTRRFVVYTLLIPVWIVIGGYALSSAHVFLAKANPTVSLAEKMVQTPDRATIAGNIDIETFMGSGKTLEELKKESAEVREHFKKAGWWLGGFLGLAFGLMLMRQTLFRHRTDFEPDKAACVSCGRCMEYCPVGKTDIEVLKSRYA